MKNCDPLVSGPEFAIDKMPAPEKNAKTFKLFVTENWIRVVINTRRCLKHKHKSTMIYYRHEKKMFMSIFKDCHIDDFATIKEA